MSLHVYTFHSHAFDLVDLQIELINKHLQPAAISIVQGPHSDRPAESSGSRRLEQCDGAQIINAPRTSLKTNATTRFRMKQKWIDAEFVKQQAEGVALFVHGDLLPIAPMDVEHALGSADMIGRRYLDRILWTWTAYRKGAAIKFPAVIAPVPEDLGPITIGDTFGGHTMKRDTWNAGALGACPDDYSDATNFEWCDPVFLHADKVSLAQGMAAHWAHKMDIVRDLAKRRGWTAAIEDHSVEAVADAMVVDGMTWDQAAESLKRRGCCDPVSQPPRHRRPPR
jgi:hypothetical protein